jgi:putative endonuclease
MDRLRDGQAWEAVARDFLRAHGLDILKQGYRCRLGELDLVCRDGTTLVVVEVRARKRSSLTSALESIDAHKQRKIILAARHLLMRHPEWNTQPLRFDVFTVTDIDTPRPRLRWIKNAFDAL